MEGKYLKLLGWGTGIRTPISGVRVSFLNHNAYNINTLRNTVSQNTTKVCYIFATVFTLLLCTGCADYKHFTDANIKWAETEATRMATESNVVMVAAKLILNGFTDASQKEASPLFQKTYIDSYGNDVTETIYDSSTHLVQLLIVQQQTKSLEIILPIVRDIFKQQQLKMEAPVTVNSVALAFVQQIPVMAAVGSMYSLGTAGIKNAGDKISSMASNTETTNTDTQTLYKEQ